MDEAAMQNFSTLTPAQQGRAIREMKKQGLSDHTIANATRLSVEQIRRVLAPAKACAEDEPWR